MVLLAIFAEEWAERRGAVLRSLRASGLIAAAEAVTIIGIPFALKDLQLAGLALAPVGRRVVDTR